MPMAMAQLVAVGRLSAFFVFAVFGGSAVIHFSTEKDNKLRNSYISITCASGVWRSSQPMQKVATKENGCICCFG
jgi:hypothetical protein